MPRHDFSPHPIADRFGLPGLNYPTPNLGEFIVVEDINLQNAAYRQLAIGTPHPDYATAALVWQGPVKGSDNQKTVRRVYSTERRAQDNYNAVLKFAEEATAYPIFIRTYVEKQSDYRPYQFPHTKLAPLTSLIGLTLTNGGSGYSGENLPSVVISGTGEDATAALEVHNGKIIALWLTDGGTGYTAAPTVTFVGGLGTGATATAYIQPQSAVLVKEDAQPADGELASIFFQVTRIYKTLPGPPLTSLRVNERGALETVVTQEVASGTEPDADGLLVTQSQVIAKDSVLSEKTTATVDSYPTLSTISYDRGFVMGARVVETDDEVVPTATVPRPSFADGIIDARLIQISPTKARLLVTRLAPEEAFQPTFETHVDETTGITIDLKFELCEAGTLGGVSGANHVEVQKIDEYFSLKITSTLRAGTIPADMVYPFTGRDSFPAVLRDLVLFDNNGTPGLVYNLIRGYSGPLDARLTRKYMTNAQFNSWDSVNVGSVFTRRPKVTQFFPQQSQVAGDQAASAKIYIPGIPDALHPQYDFTLTIGGSSTTATIPATIPADLPYNMWIVTQITPEQWRFGYWRVDITEILVPPDMQTG